MLHHSPQALMFPAATPLQKRNTVADWMFYDVGNLTGPEFNMLAGQISPEGSILAVKPTGGSDSIHVSKYANDDALRAAPGDYIQHFVIAGVGSSDVGAASLARTRANQLDKPVAAIVAGYGMADILQEALGGWFFFGAANRLQALTDRYMDIMTPDEVRLAQDVEKEEDAELPEHGSDTRTLITLLQEDARDVQSLVGHSKGCLSIAFALNDLRNEGGPEALKPVADVEVITAGAVCDMPPEMTRLRQYLGGIDWFGGMNSISGVPHISVPNAWHHLNTDLPFHMNFSEVLMGHYD